MCGERRKNWRQLGFLQKKVKIGENVHDRKKSVYTKHYGGAVSRVMTCAIDEWPGEQSIRQGTSAEPV